MLIVGQGTLFASRLEGHFLSLERFFQLGLEVRGSGESPLNFIIRNDIGIHDVLKDASATAIYGSRGAMVLFIIYKPRTGRQGFQNKPLLFTNCRVYSNACT